MTDGQAAAIMRVAASEAAQQAAEAAGGPVLDAVAPAPAEAPALPQLSGRDAFLAAAWEFKDRWGLLVLALIAAAAYLYFNYYTPSYKPPGEVVLLWLVRLFCFVVHAALPGTRLAENALERFAVRAAHQNQCPAPGIPDHLVTPLRHCKLQLRQRRQTGRPSAARRSRSSSRR